ncbi:RNA polymerase factor sigma-54 [Alicyclobacillus kakegawensis]|uniref:RNA polymerase factor sigma-54 n=1 Tax=Alicyclobacillus kakegawensis TaxID=392012 RepID=UPI0008350727|nr:RNA polymerase factor sigma-54 [Alicyclobacillus kakegawensis]
MQFELIQEQTQKLVMTTQMRQAIELLQCTTAELDSLLATMALDNPLVEYEPPPFTRTSLAQWLAGGSRGPVIENDADERWRREPAGELSLYDQLDLQLRTSGAPAPVIRLARRLLGYLDDSGFLGDLPPAEALAEESRWLDDAVALLQSCDPPGIGARNLQECLLLQVAAVPASLRPLVRQLIERHLDDVAAGRWQRLCQALGEPKDRVQAAVDALRRLNPRPGWHYAGERPVYVVPELEVRPWDGGYLVLPRESAYPRLRWNRHYLRLLQSPPDSRTAEFLRQKQQSVEWLLRCLEQRRQTLQRVAEAIVAAQQPFFQHGPARLQPLTLREVADQVGVHESTVSRATRGKYMQTPHGIWELKSFFAGELTSDHEGVSAQAVKQLMRDWVAQEDPRQPLSDQAICERLKAAGIHVSRRTVAKYREQMAIPSSNKRRRLA